MADYQSTEEKRIAIAKMKLRNDWQKGVSYTQDSELVEACYTMSLPEKRVLMLGISKVNPFNIPPLADPSVDLSSYNPHAPEGIPLLQPYEFTITTEEWIKHFPTQNPWRDMKNACDSLPL
jgi:hypothetical protein